MADEPSDPMRPTDERPEPIAYRAMTPAERVTARRRGLGVWLWWAAAVPLMILLLYLLAARPPTSRANPAANAVKCASNLWQVGQGIEFFVRDNGGRYPSSFGELQQTQDLSFEVFACPSGDANPLSASSTTGPSAWPDVCGDYIYLGAGLRRGVPSDVVVAYERSYNLHLNSINVLFADGRVDPLTRDQFLKAFERSDGLRRAWDQQRPR